ncbi:MAG TPA: ABC transporter ATP-binding protein [Anaerolineae bacterium]|nr:ABC transporter ATP-binding protein [Anaerolineae bacterium]
MIRTEGLSKTFGENKKQPAIHAVEDLSLDIKQGEVFGFLGPNGAGKTTTVRMLCALIGATRGRAWVNNYELGRQSQQVRASVGILTEQPGMYDRLSAEKNLTIYARLYGVKDVPGQVEKYLRMLGLWERRKDPAGSFSKGMKQKLAIARAILHEPATLFLDEPTAGLDPEAAKLVRDFVEELKTEGRTIFLCTHNLDEADRLCSQIGVFKQRLIKVDTPSRMKTAVFGRQVEFRLKQTDPSLVGMMKRFDFVKQAALEDTRLLVGLDNPEESNPVIIKALVEAGLDVQFVSEVRHSLEDVYFSLINNGNHR